MSSNDRNRRSVLNSAFPMLSVFATWASTHSHYCSPAKPTPALSLAQGLARNPLGGHRSTGELDEQHADRSSTHAENVDDNVDVAPPAIFQDEKIPSTSHAAAAAADFPAELEFSSSQEWEEAFLADSDLVRSESRSFSALKVAFSSLNPFIQSTATRTGKRRAGKGSEVGEQQQQQVPHYLREHIELRGFLPIAAAIEVLFSLLRCLLYCFPIFYTYFDCVSMYAHVRCVYYISISTILTPLFHFLLCRIRLSTLIPSVGR